MKKIAVIALLLLGELCYGDNSMCQAGLTTQFDGFQGLASSISYVSFSSSNSSIFFESPITDNHNSLADLYISMWLRFDNMSAISPLTTSLLQCLIPQVGSSFEITVLEDPMNPADVKL